MNLLQRFRFELVLSRLVLSDNWCSAKADAEMNHYFICGMQCTYVCDLFIAYYMCIKRFSFQPSSLLVTLLIDTGCFPCCEKDLEQCTVNFFCIRDCTESMYLRVALLNCLLHFSMFVMSTGLMQ